MTRETKAAYDKQRYGMNRESILIKQKLYRRAHAESVRKKARVYADSHREQRRAYRQKYYRANRQRLLKEMRLRGITCREQKAAYDRIYSAVNREHIRRRKAGYQDAHRKQLRLKATHRARLLRAKDPERARAKSRAIFRSNLQVKLRSVLSCRIRKALKGHTQHPTSSLIYLGCSVAAARAHIESQFSAGMAWNNHSRRGWHIDHIVPLSLFDMTDEEQRKKSFHYTNLQPLWATHNHIKHNRMLTADQLAQLI